MEMPIDERIAQLVRVKHYASPRHYETLDVAIETMRKYQKIQEIVRWNNAPSPYYKPDGQLFREICEVIEDGNGVSEVRI